MRGTATKVSCAQTLSLRTSSGSRTQVYSEPLCRRHHCAWFSEALLLRVLLPLIAIAVSLVVSFATGGFWVKIKPAQSQPEVHFTYDAIFMFQVRISTCAVFAVALAVSFVLSCK